MNKTIQLELGLEEPLTLHEAVEIYFAENIHNGFIKPFKLDRIEHSYAVPVSPQGGGELFYNEVDPEWHHGLALLGKRYGINWLKIPYWCYSK